VAELDEFFRRIARWMDDAANNRAGLWGQVVMCALGGGVLMALLLAVMERNLPPLKAVLGWAVIFAMFGAAEYKWRHGWKQRVRPRHIITAVLAVMVAGLGLVIATAPPIAPGAKFYYPGTLTDSGWLVILPVALFLCSGGVAVGRQQMPDGSGNARYLALGLGLLAVVALALVRSQQELVGVGSSLRQFFGALPAHWRLLPTPAVIGLGVLALLAVIGLFRVATGWQGPFLKRGLRGAGGDLFWLFAAAGLWWWGAFVPKDFGWFEALDVPRAYYIVNFGLQAFYLFMIVVSGVTIALLMGGGRIDFDSFGGGGPRRPVRGS
jgi:hypothetical protein